MTAPLSILPTKPAPTPPPKKKKKKPKPTKGNGTDVIQSTQKADSMATPPPGKKARHGNPDSSALTPASKPSAPAGSESAQNVLVYRAIKGAQAEAARTPNRSNNTTNSLPPTPGSSNSRAQFEEQNDFISFDFEDEEEERPARNSPRGSASKGRDSRGAPGGSGTKRKLDEYEEKQDQGSKRLAKREKERTTPWCESPGVDWDSCTDAISRLNAECRAFITYISPTPVEHQLRHWTIELIRRAVTSRWSDANVECFGSVGTGLYLPGGDIDLVVLCPSFPSPPLKPTSSLLHHLASLLLTSNIAEPSSLLVIAKARVPIVKFTTRYGGFSVDLSVNQKNGVEAAVRVRDMLETFAFRGKDYVEPGAEKATAKGKGKGKEKEKVSDDAADEEASLVVETVDYGVARSLVMLVKAFLNQRGMNEVFTGGLGSYSIICMVVSFLQLHPRIQTGEILPEKNIGLLFVEFLEYYGKHFNYNEAGITLRGRGGYYNKHHKGWFRPNQPYLLSIEDPNDPTNDVSGGSHNLPRVRQTLAGAFDVLTATLCHRVSHLEALHNPSHIPLTGAALPNADHAASSPLRQSILGSVIGMSRPAIAARNENVKLYDSGVLQAKIEMTTNVGQLGSKKAIKRARKEAKEMAQKQRTIARLETRMDEREKKRERKERKKLELQEAAAAVSAANSSRSTSVSGMTNREDDDDKEVGMDEEETENERSIPRQLFQDDGEESDDSRYAIAPSAVKPTPAKKVVYVHGSSSEGGATSDSDDQDGEESGDDDDVVIGGHVGGDRLTASTAANGRSAAKTALPPQPPNNSDSSDEEVSRHLVIRGLAASTTASQAAPKKESKEGRLARVAERSAFWTTKGPKEAPSRHYDA